jgi:hypothetical protein
MNNFLTNVSLNIEPLTFDVRNPDDKLYQHYELDLNTINPKMKSFLQGLGIKVSMIEVFFTPPYKTRGIHIDTAHGGDITKLNWVYCDGDNIMNWYEPKLDISRIIQNESVSTSYLSYEPDEVNLVHSETLTSNNVIVQVGSAHNVKNLKDPRWAICFTIHHLHDGSRVTVSQAQEIFKDYIIETH